jgi:tetratricopeptide (TPR) repeat protein
MDATTARGLVTLAEDARDLRRRQDPAAERVLEERYPELGQALDWFAEAGRPDDAGRLATALVTFWIATKRLADADAWFDRALRDPRASELTRARALYDHGYVVFWAGRYDLAEQRFRDSLALARQLGQPSLQALALAGLGRVVINTDPSDAVRLLREAMSVTAGLDDADEGRSSAMHVLGVALQLVGDFTAAREVMSTRLEVGRSRGDDLVVWAEASNLSMVERQLGNLDRAEQLSREALALGARRRDDMAIAWLLNGLAAVTAAKARVADEGWERAATLNGLAASLLERAGGEWPADERAQYEETLVALRAALSPEVMDRARERGATMTTDEGVAYAMLPDATVRG